MFKLNKQKGTEQTQLKAISSIEAIIAEYHPS